MKERLEWIALIGGGALFFAGLISDVWAAGFVRYMADDYDYAFTLARYGFFGDQVNYYLTWSGRFSATFLAALAELGGPGDIALVLGLMFAVWFVGSVLLGTAAGRVLGAQSPVAFGCFVGGAVITAALVAAPTMAQSVYWQIGMVSYAAPLALGTAVAACIVRFEPQRVPALAALAVAGAVTVGFSETATLVTVTALMLAVTLAVYGHSAAFRRPLAAVSIGCGAGLVGMVAAPGNQVRASYLPPHPSVLYALHAGTLSALSDVRFILPVVTVVLIAGIAASVGIGARSRLSRRDLYVILLVASVGTILGFLIPEIAAWYLESGALPTRSLLDPIYLAVATSFASGLILGAQMARERRQGYQRIAVLVLVLCTLGLSTVGGIGMARWSVAASEYARQWDARQVILHRDAGHIATVAPLTNPARLADVRSGPDRWVIPYVAAYDHDATIVLRPAGRR